LRWSSGLPLASDAPWSRGSQTEKTEKTPSIGLGTPAFLREALAAAETLIPGIRPVPFGHVGDGNLHFNFTQPVGADKEAYLEQWEALNRVVHDIVIAHGGSISAEHGIGVLKREEGRRYKSDVELELLRRIKQALDPKGIMNPGKGIV
jgi:FAD/FMN-containing dehydrogenase